MRINLFAISSPYKKPPEKVLTTCKNKGLRQTQTVAAFHNRRTLRSPDATHHLKILQTHTPSPIRFPRSGKRFRALASAAVGCLPEEASTAKSGATYMTNEEGQNRQFQGFFWKCFVNTVCSFAHRRGRVWELRGSDLQARDARRLWCRVPGSLPILKPRSISANTHFRADDFP